MDTTLPLPFLPSVDISKIPGESDQGLTESQLSYLGCVYFTATTPTIDALLQYLQTNVATEAYVNVTEIESKDDIVTILDSGARKVFVTSAQSESLATYGDRIIPTFSEAVTTYSNGTFVDAGSDVSTWRASLEKLVASKVSPVFITSSTSDLESFTKLAAEFNAIPVLPSSNLTLGASTKDFISVPELIGSLWTSDRTDKLVPTVVTDERGFALGLVYSSQESLAESLKTGTGVYQSRKRGLWYKGATSGDVQELVRISLDCDQDCLKFVVRQKGRGRSTTKRSLEYSNTSRFLSPATTIMFRRVPWYFEIGKDFGLEKGICSRRVIYSASFQ